MIGATELAVEDAVWDLLYRGLPPVLSRRALGSRPASRNWPRPWTSRKSPDYPRRIWYGFGPWDYAAEPYRDWCAGIGRVGVKMNSGHSYGGFVRPSGRIRSASGVLRAR